MARKESPENHLAAIAAVAAISLVLVQTITDRSPSTSPAYGSRSPAETSCTPAGSALTSSAVPAATASRVRVNCLQVPETTRARVGAG
jgi:hypothetical protein